MTMTAAPHCTVCFFYFISSPLRCCRLRLFAVTMNPDDVVSRLENEASVFFTIKNEIFKKRSRSFLYLGLGLAASLFCPMILG